MKKLFITGACIATVLSSFANPATHKNKKDKVFASTFNVAVTTSGTQVKVTAVSDSPKAVSLTMLDGEGNELYEGKLTRGECSQFAVFNLEQLAEGTYSIVLQNGIEKVEKTISVNVNTSRQLTVE